MTLDYLMHYCRGLYPKWDDELCSRLVERLSLDRKMKLKNLSRGMKLRASFVSSLAYRPRMLVLDEPFGGLDPLAREEIIQVIKEMRNEEPFSILLCSHDISEVEQLADSVGIIEHGRMKAVRPMETLPSKSLREFYLSVVRGDDLAVEESQS